MEAIWWPLAVVIIVLVLLFTQKKSLARLIDRTKEVTRMGIKAAEIQPQKTADAEPQSVDELMKAFDSPLLREREKGIEQHLTTSGLTSDADKIKVLIRHLAATQLGLSCSEIDKSIWGSQVGLLQHLNAVKKGPRDILKVVYDAGATQYPNWYSSYPYEKWLQYLKNSGLILEDGAELYITQFGVEFLGYLTLIGRANAHIRPG